MHSNALPASVPVLTGRHELTLHTLNLEPDSFTLTSSLVPAIPEGPDGTSPILLILEAEDDLGNEYTDWGGAFGPSSDGSSSRRTEGTLTGQPGLPSEARELHVRVTFLKNGEEHPNELTLPLLPY